jgi:hypothetical protein
MLLDETPVIRTLSMKLIVHILTIAKPPPWRAWCNGYYAVRVERSQAPVGQKYIAITFYFRVRNTTMHNAH